MFAPGFVKAARRRAGSPRHRLAAACPCASRTPSALGTRLPSPAVLEAIRASPPCSVATLAVPRTALSPSSRPLPKSDPVLSPAAPTGIAFPIRATCPTSAIAPPRTLPTVENARHAVRQPICRSATEGAAHPATDRSSFLVGVAATPTGPGSGPPARRNRKAPPRRRLFVRSGRGRPC